MLSIPIVKSAHSRIFHLTSHGTLVCPLRTIGDPQGPLGGPSVTENCKLNASNYQLRPSALQRAADKCHRWRKNLGKISRKIQTFFLHWHWPSGQFLGGLKRRYVHWGGYRKPWILFQSPEKNYFSHLLKKCYLLKEKILGLCLGCPQHRAYYHCFGGTKK